MELEFNKKNVETIVIYALFALLFVLLARILSPLYSVILWVILIYILISPLYTKVLSLLDEKKKFYRFKRRVLAASFSVGTTLLIVVPVCVIAYFLFRQFFSLLRSIEFFVKTNPHFLTESDLGKSFSDIIVRITFGSINPYAAGFSAQILDMLNQSSAKLLSTGTSILGSMGHFAVSLLFVVFCIFFVFSDGPDLAVIIKKAIPVNSAYMTALSEKFAHITRRLFSGYILVALYQAIAAFVIMTIFKVQGALFFSFVLMFCSFVPIFGAAIIWLPVGISVLLVDSVFSGVLFLLFSAVFVSSLDNFLRPLLLQNRINIHPLIIFFCNHRRLAAIRRERTCFGAFGGDYVFDRARHARVSR
ncbi:MAG: AI-2E family transporter [Treponemataceae bacterium]|nr:MAG: AI-2E family transporter [Treponemataceae bacterium]